MELLLTAGLAALLVVGVPGAIGFVWLYRVFAREDEGQ